jgi:uncharacterized membrane protein YphA (DoxX/SURF4 family)
MGREKGKMTIRILHYILGGVILLQSIRVAVYYQEVAHSSHIPFPAHFVLVLASLEAIGALLFLLPWTFKPGAWLLLAVLFFAVLVHTVHGQFEGLGMLVYAAGVLAVMYNERGEG